MSRYAALNTSDGHFAECLSALTRDLMDRGVVDAVLVPARQPFGTAVMQTLITDPTHASRVDPLAPVAPVSSATQLSKLTRKAAKERVAAFLRPCEVRALIELVKLRQASLDHVLLIGMDCHGRYGTRDHANLLAHDERATLDFLRSAANGQGTALSAETDIVGACHICETPEADQVDIRLQVFGHNPEEALGLEGLTPAGEAALEALGLPAASPPAARAAAVQTLRAARKKRREASRRDLAERVGTVQGLMEVISGCVNCYNCRSACPVCYCRECVFATDTFQHDSQQYFGWAAKRGSLRMPADTLFYHLTRMAHISTLCVGCGQCSSACPNDIPVSDLCGLVGEKTQGIFAYVPGRSVEEAQPLATFVEDELVQVTGQVK